MLPVNKMEKMSVLDVTLGDSKYGSKQGFNVDVMRSYGKGMIFNLKFKLTACILTVEIPSWFAFGITEKTKLIRADIRDKVSSGPLLLGSEEETSASKTIVPYKPLTGLSGLRPHKKTPLPLFI